MRSSRRRQRAVSFPDWPPRTPDPQPSDPPGPSRHQTSKANNITPPLPRRWTDFPWPLDTWRSLGGDPSYRAAVPSPQQQPTDHSTSSSPEERTLHHWSYTPTTGTTTELDSECLAFKRCARSLLQSAPLFDLIPEHTRMVTLDTRVPMHVAMRSIMEYRKPFVSLFSEALRTFVGFIDGHEILSYCLKLAAIPPQPPPPSHSPISRRRSQSGSAPPSSKSSPQQTTAQQPTPTITSQQQDNNIYTPRHHLSRGGGGGGGGDIDSDISGGIRTADGGSSSNESSSAATSLIRKQPALATMTIEQWKDYSEPVPSYPILSVTHSTAEEALHVLMHCNIKRVVVWNAEKEAPLSFVTLGVLLTYFVQNMRGTHSVLDCSVKGTLQLCKPPSEILHFPENTPMQRVLLALIETKETSFPITDPDTGAYIGSFNVHHFLHIISRGFREAAAAVEGDAPAKQIDLGVSVGAYWEELICAGLATSTVHFYPNESSEMGAQDTGTAPGSPATLEPRPGPTSMMIDDDCYETSALAVAKPFAGSAAISTSPLGSPAPTGPPSCSPSQDLGIEPARQSSGSLAHFSHGATGPAELSPTFVDAAVSNTDLSLRGAISHILLSEDQRLLFVDPLTRRLTGLVTIRDLCDFMFGDSPFAKTRRGHL